MEIRWILLCENTCAEPHDFKDPHEQSLKNLSTLLLPHLLTNQPRYPHHPPPLPLPLLDSGQRVSNPSQEEEIKALTL